MKRNLPILQSIKKSSSSLVLDHTAHAKMNELFSCFGQSFGTTEGAPTNPQSSLERTESMPRTVSQTVQTSPPSFIPDIGEPFTERYPRPSDASTHLSGLMPAMNQTHRESMSVSAAVLIIDKM